MTMRWWLHQRQLDLRLLTQRGGEAKLRDTPQRVLV